ncbi:MAG: HAMP domain-containing sensor histidine kinase [Pirellulales bacterium]
MRALAAAGAGRVIVFEAALEDDAAFARWSASERRARNLPAVDTAWQMATWLAEALLDLCRSAPVDPIEEEGSALAAAAAWAAAGCAGALAAPLGAEPAARASWRGLLEAPASSPDAEGVLTVAAIAVRAERALVDEGVSPSREELWNAAARWRERANERLAEWRAAADPTWAACLAELWPALARLAALEARFDEALRDAKLTALKAFAYGAGHEINNPLANIASRAQSLLADESHPERRRRLAAINAQAFRAHEMLADLMLFARPPQLAPKEVDLHKELSELVAQFAAQAAEQNTALACEASNEIETAWADPVQLRVALAALVRNALEALAEGGQVTVRSARQQTAGGEFISISVEDTGPGIPSENLVLIFDPFYSGREAGRGLGFGLPKAWRIAAAHGGRLEVRSELGQGAAFRLWLPVQRPEAGVADIEP